LTVHLRDGAGLHGRGSTSVTLKLGRARRTVVLHARIAGAL
jgi:hypothetical protein